MSDQVRCFYCDTTEGPFQVDHLIPFARGGSSTTRNLVDACVRCNLEKSDRLPSEWREDLPDRVYALERRLREWHRDVNERKRRRFSVSQGDGVIVRNLAAIVERVDDRGILLRPVFRDLAVARTRALTDLGAWLDAHFPSIDNSNVVDVLDGSNAFFERDEAQFHRSETIALISSKCEKADRASIVAGKRTPVAEYLRTAVRAHTYHVWLAWPELRTLIVRPALEPAFLADAESASAFITWAEGGGAQTGLEAVAQWMQGDLDRRLGLARTRKDLRSVL